MATHPLKPITDLDPVFMEHLKKMEEDFIYPEGALPRKFKYLMALAFDAQQGAVNGVKHLACQAKAHGASKEEVAETLRLAFYFGGIGAVYIGSQGLEGVFD
jgi:alkylhydroperoxidase/carboxymuconolactone decarboxylase family protein YurZ